MVDDDDTFRSTVERILTNAGFDTIEACTGEAALALAGLNHFDAVLLDVGLPDMNGLKVCKVLKQRAPNGGLSVVHLSGSAVAPCDRVRGLDGGADGYLTKPIVPAELVATLRSTIRSRSESRP